MAASCCRHPSICHSGDLGFSLHKVAQSTSQAGPISKYSQSKREKGGKPRTQEGIFPCQAQDIKAAVFNTHWSLSFQGSQNLQALPVFITCLGAPILELWGFPAPPVLVLLPLPGIQGGKVLQTHTPKPILAGLTDFGQFWGFHKDLLAAGRDPQVLEPP